MAKDHDHDKKTHEPPHQPTVPHASHPGQSQEQVQHFSGSLTPAHPNVNVPHAGPVKPGVAIHAADPETATPEARAKAARAAELRNAPASHQEDPGPEHKFKLEYQGQTETIKVKNRNFMQAEIEARAQFNGKIKAQPNPRLVKVEYLN